MCMLRGQSSIRRFSIYRRVIVDRYHLVPVFFLLLTGSPLSRRGDDCGEHIGCLPTLLPRDVEMGRRSHGARGEGTDQHTLLLGARDDRRRVRRARRQAEDHDVALHRREIEKHALYAGQPLRDEPGIGMILWQPRQIVLERVEPRGGDDAGLAQRAAEHAPRAHSALDIGHPPGDDAADRAAEPLRQGDGNEVERRRQLDKRAVGGGHHIEQPGAIEVTGDAKLSRGAADRLDIALRKDDAAAAIMRVLDRHQRGRREDDMARRLVGGAEILGGEKAAAAPDSCHTICASSPTTTSSPGRVSTLRPIWFAMVPLGTNSAASLPSSAAMRSCRRLTEGSSPYWSSPTGASAIALRMPGEGKVTVSERRSMRSMEASQASDFGRAPIGGKRRLGVNCRAIADEAVAGCRRLDCLAALAKTALAAAC